MQTYAVIRITLDPVAEYDCESDKEMEVLADKVDVLIAALETVLPQLDKDFHFDVST